MAEKPLVVPSAPAPPPSTSSSQENEARPTPPPGQQRRINMLAVERDVDEHDFCCPINFTNTLPDVPFDAKFIPYPFDLKRFVRYKPTVMDKCFKNDIICERELEIPFDLMDPFSLTNAKPALDIHPDDQVLCEPDEEAEQSTHDRKVPWLRRPEYVSIWKLKKKKQLPFSNRPPVRQPPSATVASIKDLLPAYRDRDSQIEVINRTFEDVKRVNVSKPGVTVVEEMPIFPDFRMWKLACAQVIFDVDPAAPESTSVPEMKTETLALIRGMTDDSDNHFVAYLLPSESTCHVLAEKREFASDENLMLEYRLFRQYNWLLKSKATPGYEESFFFNIRNGSVYYNELETRVHLTRRKMTKASSAVVGSRIVVNYRPLNDVELEAQASRIASLEPIVIGEDEEYDEQEGVARPKNPIADTDHIAVVPSPMTEKTSGNIEPDDSAVSVHSSGDSKSDEWMDDEGGGVSDE